LVNSDGYDPAEASCGGELEVNAEKMFQPSRIEGLLDKVNLIVSRGCFSTSVVMGARYI